MTQTSSMGHQTRIGISKASPTTQEIEFISCDMGAKNQHVQSDGIRGQRGRQSESVLDGIIDVSGSLVLEPRYEDLIVMLELILGTAAAPNYTLAEVVPFFTLDFKKIADTYRYANCKVNTATFRSARNQPLQLTLDIVGKTETGSISFPNIAATLSALQPYIHHQLVMTIGGTAYELDNLEVSISNALLTDRYNNSQTRTDIPEGDRVITVSATFPFTTDQAALYGMAVAGLAGANTAVWTNGAHVLTMTFGKLQAPTISPGVGAKNQEITRTIQFNARKIGATAELAVSST